ncbi:MAG: BBP7 family outer membrane beta-barrel protein [Planctomycetaceae bacterium]
MFRTNLLRYVLTLMIAAGACSAANAQHFGGAPAFLSPGSGGQITGFRPPQSQYQAPTVDYYVGKAQPLWDDQQPVEKFLTEVAHRSWLRLEYMHWDLDDAGSGNFGAPVNGDTTPTFAVNDIESPTTLRGQALIPQRDLLGLNDVSGVRGTLGVALNGGSLELSVFGTEQGSSQLSYNNLQARRDIENNPRDPAVLRLGTVALPNVVTPLLADGVVSNATAVDGLVYDQSFAATLRGQMWGGEMLLLMDSYIPDDSIQWQWLGGFRYLNYDESAAITGVFNDGGAQIPARVTQIGGNTINNIYGPEIGARLSLTSRFLTLSATPRIAFALNDNTSEVYSTGLNAADLTVSRVTANTIDFTPVVQVALLGGTSDPATESGVVASIDTEAIGMAIIAMNGGRQKLGDTIDHSTGIEMLVRIDDVVERGQPLARVFSPEASRHLNAVRAAFKLSDSAVAPALIAGRV